MSATRSKADAPPVTARRVTPDAYQLVRDKEIVALALLLTNDRWIHADLDGRQMGTETYPTPRAVAAAASKRVIEAGKREP
ncbi:hypothetical protein [Rhodanobacter sp. FW106-PBR-LB-2-11]|uniref:hypothetical protein n=1 Tax=Rhodanobacter sp. FW106-PBR-LB-2-11 TaxID=1524463 RepID=UPI0034E544BD